MTTVCTALACLAATCAAIPGTAVAQGNPHASIPAQFRGRWAETPRACRGADPNHSIVTIDSGGWSAPMEQEGRVTGVGPVHGGTHAFDTINWAGPSELDGVMTLRRTANRLTMTLSVAGGSPVRHNLMRCR